MQWQDAGQSELSPDVSNGERSEVIESNKEPWLFKTKVNSLQRENPT